MKAHTESLVPECDSPGPLSKTNWLAHSPTFIARASLNVDKALLVRYSRFSCTPRRPKVKAASNFPRSKVIRINLYGYTVCHLSTSRGNPIAWVSAFCHICGGQNR